MARNPVVVIDSTHARDLVDTIRRNVTIDWTVKENVRAKLRTMVKKVLRKHGYPPDKRRKSGADRVATSGIAVPGLGGVNGNLEFSGHEEYSQLNILSICVIRK